MTRQFYTRLSWEYDHTFLLFVHPLFENVIDIMAACGWEIQ